ncbi:hypothetical protein ACR3K2_26900 [Cryptosporidium serpentis]
MYTEINSPIDSKSRSYILSDCNEINVTSKDSISYSINIENSPKLVLENGDLNILHQWDWVSQFLLFCFHDRFHVMLAMSWYSLIVLICCMHLLLAIMFACCLYVITLGDALNCVGSNKLGALEYFFFAIETMFSVGYGSPRSPTCIVTDYFVAVMAISSSILNSLTVGIFFAKFSDATSRRWSICFSKELCGIGFEKLPQELLYHTNTNITNTLDYSTPIRVSAGIDDSCPFTLSFRLINISHESFTSPKLKVFLLVHSSQGLSIAEVTKYKLDVPLEFMEMPITVTMVSNDPTSPLKDLTLGEIRNKGHLLELMVLLHFVDNRTSKSIEVRKSWKLSNITWGYRFAPIVRRPLTQDGVMYEVGVSDVDNVEPALSGTYT